ncbi:MAG: NAD(+)/NADH kinase [Clostridia bacterium]|nr:NAD(+)/NADH kinase [Clostridia bacterium]
MKIGIVSNPIKDSNFATAIRAAGIIRSLGAMPVVDADDALSSNVVSAHAIRGDLRSCDLILCLGGDGTFLSVVQSHHAQGIPIIGVNLGSLGFLAEIQPEDLEDGIKTLVEGRYRIEERMLLQASFLDASGMVRATRSALNDVVVSRGGISRILTTVLSIGGHPVERIPGDGIIVSTPTGSTGYSLSAGGPIIQPDLSLMLVTPICPHTLHNRSYVVSSDSEVGIGILDYPFSPVVSIDGRPVGTLSASDRILVRKAPNTMKLAKIDSADFYVKLPVKISERGGVR